MNLLHIIALLGVLLSVTGCPHESEHKCLKIDGNSFNFI